MFGGMGSGWAVEQTDSPFNQNSPGRWFVLHVKSRQEKQLSSELFKKKVPHFFPSVRQPRYFGKRKCVVDQALFPGYLFIRVMQEDAFISDRTGRVASVISVANQEKLHWELWNLSLVLGATSDQILDLYPYLTVGVRVEVRSGPFRGVQGWVADRTRLDRLILQVEMLGQALSLEVDGSLLDLIDS